MLSDLDPVSARHFLGRAGRTPSKYDRQKCRAHTNYWGIGIRCRGYYGGKSHGWFIVGGEKAWWIVAFGGFSNIY